MNSRHEDDTSLAIPEIITNSSKRRILLARVVEKVIFRSEANYWLKITRTYENTNMESMKNDNIIPLAHLRENDQVL